MEDPKTNELWRQLRFPDDPVKHSNLRGYISYATDGPNTRTTQVFINLEDNKKLDARGFSPFGKVTEGMEAVDKFYSYGEVQSLGGGGPDTAKMETLGDEVTSAKIGEAVMAGLKTVDHVAYIRFASIYKDFSEPGDFAEIAERVEKEAVPLDHDKLL